MRKVELRSAWSRMHAYALLALALAACAPEVASWTAEHPASPEAPIGRLAEPPSAFQPGAAASNKVEPEKVEPIEPKKPDPMPPMPGMPMMLGQGRH